MTVKPSPKGPNQNKIDKFLHKEEDKQSKNPIKTTMLLPVKLLKRIDEHCEKTYQNRTAFIIQCVLKELDRNDE